MANEIITTLHPDGNPDIDLYPNIKKENIPNKAIDRNKLDSSINNLLNNIGELHPSGNDTSTNILAFTEDKGIYIGTDTGNWYYWDGSQYVSGGSYISNMDVVNENRLAINDIDDVVFYNKSELTTQNKVIATNLNISDNSNYAISDVIHIYPNQKIKGKTYIESGVCVIAECDSNGTLIRNLKSSNTTQANFEFELLFTDETYIKICLRTNGSCRLYKDLQSTISDLSNSLGYQVDKSKYQFSKNLYNYRTRSEKGYWCNYTNGQIQSNQYVTYYSYSEYIEVEPSTQYTRTTGNRGTVFFDKNKNYISGVTTNTFTTPSNCKYVIINCDYDTAYYWMLVKGDSLPSIYHHYYLDLKYVNPESDMLLIGTGTDYPTIKDGLEYAVANGLGVIITPGTYDLVSEGITGVGYYAPKKIYAYGVTFVCNLDNEDWNLSPLNINNTLVRVQPKTEIYGLTIICSNCRYCIHDEMGGNTSYYYHNIYKDLTLINNGTPSDVLLAPQCIGGGIGGKGGYVEVVNCITESNYVDDISYHTQFDGNQTGDCTIIIKDCDIKTTVRISAIGTSTSFKNVMRVTNCLVGSLPNVHDDENTKLISWNNVLRS